MEKTIRGHYAPTDRRSAVLRNYYGVTGDMVHHHYRRMEHVLGNYYGQADLYHHEVEGPGASGEAAVPAATVVTARSFDDGEVLVQKESDVQKDNTGEEYIVEKTFEEEPCEEYVVYSQSMGEEVGEEYVVYSQSEDDAAKGGGGPADLDAYDKEVLKELNIDISNPLAQAKAVRFRALEVEAVPDKEDGGIVPGGGVPMGEPAPTPGSKEERDLFADIQSIMNTPIGTRPSGGGGMDSVARSQAAASPAPPAPEPPLPPNGHAIFDRIAKSMKYANAYDLGAVELDNRFAEFDKYYEGQQAPKREVATSMDSDIPNPADFIKDLDSILKGDVASQQPQGGGYGDTFFSLSTPKPDDPAWPPKPTNLRPYTSAERIAKFGEFQYEPDPGSYNGDGIKVLNGWDAQHIVMVDIPQLNALKHPKVQFHKLGATSLQELWKAWEDAGLVDRIVSFDGSYATRFIRHTEDRNPRPVSNHAWGTAFDINAAENPFGGEPALVGKKGSVRELVEIANQHGFYWGGHFGGHKDGMHFELGKMIN